MAGLSFEEEVAKGTFKDVKALLFDPQDNLDIEIGLFILDTLHEKGELTQDQLAWLRDKLSRKPLIFNHSIRRSLPKPPPNDRFWWYDQDETPEAQIARDLEFETSYSDMDRSSF
jgi:hypothetical protein